MCPCLVLLPLRFVLRPRPQRRSLGSRSQRPSRRRSAPLSSQTELPAQLDNLLSLVLDDRCVGYIGYDGGHSHLLSLPKPSVTIYTMGEHEKWRTYTGNPYKKIELLDGISMECSPLDDTVKGILHRDLPCNPCFYRPCSDPVCQAVPLLDCWDHLRRLFSL